MSLRSHAGGKLIYRSYEVEAIKGHEWRKKKLLYNVKWKGFPESDNTLEPEENLVT